MSTDVLTIWHPQGYAKHDGDSIHGRRESLADNQWGQQETSLNRTSAFGACRCLAGARVSLPSEPSSVS